MPQKEIRMELNYGLKDKDALKMAIKVRNKIEADIKQKKGSQELLELAVLTENIYYEKVNVVFSNNDLTKFVISLFLVSSLLGIVLLIGAFVYFLIVIPGLNLLTESTADKKLDILLFPVALVLSAVIPIWIDRKFIRKKS